MPPNWLNVGCRDGGDQPGGLQLAQRRCRCGLGNVVVSQAVDLRLPLDVARVGLAGPLVRRPSAPIR